MPSWSWSAGESSPPGNWWKKALEAALWFLGGLGLQLEAARITACSWRTPDFLVLAVLGWHYLWGFRGGLVAATTLGLLVDGWSGAPVGLTVSGLVLAALIAEWFRGATVGGFGGLWVGPAFGAALGSTVWRAGIWGFTRGDWPALLDVVTAVLLTMAMAALVAVLRRRLVHPRSRRPRVVEAR